MTLLNVTLHPIDENLLTLIPPTIESVFWKTSFGAVALHFVRSSLVILLSSVLIESIGGDNDRCEREDRLLSVKRQESRETDEGAEVASPQAC